MTVTPEPVLVIFDEPGPYFTVVLHCRQCATEIARRRFDVLRDPIEDAEIHALVGGAVWRAHARACRIGALAN